MQRCRRDGVPLRRTAKQSGQARLRKKLIASSSWFKKKKRNEHGVRMKGKKKKRSMETEKIVKQ